MQTYLCMQVYEQANKVQDCRHRSEGDASGILDKHSSDCTDHKRSTKMHWILTASFLRRWRLHITQSRRIGKCTCRYIFRTSLLSLLDKTCYTLALSDNHDKWKITKTFLTRFITGCNCENHEVQETSEAQRPHPGSAQPEQGKNLFERKKSSSLETGWKSYLLLQERRPLFSL